MSGCSKPQSEALKDLLMKYGTVSYLVESIQSYADWNLAKCSEISHIWTALDGLRILLRGLDKEAEQFFE